MILGFSHPPLCLVSLVGFGSLGRLPILSHHGKGPDPDQLKENRRTDS